MEQSPFCRPLACQEISPHFVSAESSLPLSQLYATRPYPEPEQSSPCPPPTSWRSTLILCPHIRIGIQSGIFPSHVPCAKSHVHFPLVLYQSISPSPRPCDLFHNVGSYDDLFIEPHWNTKLEDHPISAPCHYWIYIFAATFHIWRPVLESQSADAPNCRDGDSLIVSTYLCWILLRRHLNRPVTAHWYIRYINH
jgi:hypothetical protein